MVFNFQQHVTDGDDVGTYDYCSIMHYGENQFAIDSSQPTIIARRSDLPCSGNLGQRNSLSAGDINAIERIYSRPISSSPSAVSWRSEDGGRIDIFARGSDFELIHKYWDGSRWSDWTSHGGILTSSPSVASRGYNRLDVFARGRNNELWHIYWNGSRWSDWSSHGGTLGTAPAAVSRGPDRLDVFTISKVGSDIHLFHKYWNGSRWSDWTSRGGIPAYGAGGPNAEAPAVASRGPDLLDVFVRGGNNELFHKYWNGSRWSDWTSHGGILDSAPTAASRGNGRLDVFARGRNNELWHIYWNGSRWSDWTSHGGILTSSPTVASRAPNRLDVFARGRNNELWLIYWNGSRWSDWNQVD